MGNGKIPKDVMSDKMEIKNAPVDDGSTDAGKNGTDVWRTDFADTGADTRKETRAHKREEKGETHWIRPSCTDAILE
jgi:hypothetical protein